MPRKPEPSYKLKEIIWDLAATAGTENIAALRRDLDYKLEELRKNQQEEFFEDLPDERTIRRIIEVDIQRISREAVIAKLPEHVWHLRSDYEAIKQLAEDTKTRQEAPSERKVEEIFYPDNRRKHHFAELSETALKLAANFERFLDMRDGIIFDSNVGNIIYGGWLEPTEYWDHLRDQYRVKMNNIPGFLALDLLSHLRDKFPELAKINDWTELTSNELTYDLIARLDRIAKSGTYEGKCNDCPQ